MKIGLIREWKEPADKRVALTPNLCRQFKTRFPNVQLAVESSPDRCFPDQAYAEIGVDIQSDMSDCDILIGIKEVPKHKLIPTKTYLFFSHTIKAQEYNRSLLQEIIAKKIRLIDYEPLLWPGGGRILGFGKWAGIVGSYNAFLTWGEKTKSFNLPPAHQTSGYEECMQLLKSVRPKGLKIAFTGNGRVAGGIREVLERMNLKEVLASEFAQSKEEETIFCQLGNEHIYSRIDGLPWDDTHFYKNHSAYKSTFKPYLNCTDILINGMYWEDDMPALFSKEDTLNPEFNIKVIADITCDVEGSIPITMEATDIYHPTYGWSKKQQKQVEKYCDDCIDIMAVTNLPTELPQNSSEEFGSLLLEHILPLLIENPEHEIIKKATITNNGNLSDAFSDLEHFVKG